MENNRKFIIKIVISIILIIMLSIVSLLTRNYEKQKQEEIQTIENNITSTYEQNDDIKGIDEYQRSVFEESIK